MEEFIRLNSSESLHVDEHGNVQLMHGDQKGLYIDAAQFAAICEQYPKRHQLIKIRKEVNYIYGQVERLYDSNGGVENYNELVSEIYYPLINKLKVLFEIYDEDYYE